MSGFLDFLKSRLNKTESQTNDIIKKTRVKNSISSICDTHLKDVGDVLRFEVSDEDLPYAVMVIDEEPLNSKYFIMQVDKTMFEASLKELEF